MFRIGLVLLFAQVCSAAAQPPNLLLIVSDDAGYADFGFQGSTEIPTPHLDQLAARGVRFTQAYTGRVCSPSRAQFLTGQYPSRFGYVRNVGNFYDPQSYPDGLRNVEQTLFEQVATAGHSIGVFGKWHVGCIEDVVQSNVLQIPGNRPPRQGVDAFVGLLGGSRRYFVGDEPGGWVPPGAAAEVTTLRRMQLQPNDLILDQRIELNDGSVNPLEDPNLAGAYLTDVLADEACAFIRDRHQASEPFFVYLSLTAPHTPLQATPADLADTRIAGLSGDRQVYAAMMLAMDRAIGAVLDQLEDPDGDGDPVDSIADNTFVVFLNDNGGASNNASDNGALRGWKGSMWEGGVRVPMLIAGAGVDPSVVGTTFDEPVSSVDVLPTMVAAAGGVLDPNVVVDGVNLLPYVNGTLTDPPHEAIYHLFSLRKGDHKVVHDDGQWKLYDLASDVAETSNLAGSQPAKLDELLQAMTDFDVQMDKARFGTYGDLTGFNNDTDHFVFDPTSGVATGTNLLGNPGFEDGDDDPADNSARYTFAELHDWDNDTGDQIAVGARDDTAASGLYRGMISWGQAPRQVTNHILQRNEVLTVTFQAAGLWQWDNGDTFDVELFYVADDGSHPLLASFNVAPQLGSYAGVTHATAPITSRAALGRLLGIRFISRANESGEWASIDDVSLASDATGVASNVFSAGNAWAHPVSGQPITFTANDGYANAVLEFPTHDAGSYAVECDLLRPTQLDLIANRLLLTGTYAGSDPATAEIHGLPLLMTSSRAGAPAGVDMAANGNAGSFTFELALDLLLYTDLLFSGTGDQELLVRGQIREYRPGATLTKTGSSAVSLAAANVLTGRIEIQQGRLHAQHPLSLGTADVRATGGELDPAGLVTIGGTYEQGAGGTLTIDLDASADKLTVSGTAQLAGTLILRTAPGFVPQPNESFDVLVAAATVGAFDAVVADCDYEVTIANGVVTVTTPCGPGDANCDGLVGVPDWLQLATCLSSPDAVVPPACADPFDADSDLDVDLRDVAAFQQRFGLATSACP